MCCKSCECLCDCLKEVTVYVISFDQDTFGIFKTRKAAEKDLARQIREGGPAWEDCVVDEYTVCDG